MGTMFTDTDESALLRRRLETLQGRLRSIRTGRRVLMDLLAAQLEEKRRLSENLRLVRKHHRRNTFRCLRLEARLRDLEHTSSTKER